ncbi:MAG: hypothetical protein QMD06_03125 [Candidatus Altarchaeum sp.]|nr:hypothetical protein [Candidatus Altarchaeum sp.]
MALRKIRIIMDNGEQTAYGITIPPDVAEKYKDTYFFIESRQTQIILHSGARPSTAELPKFSY